MPMRTGLKTAKIIGVSFWDSKECATPGETQRLRIGAAKQWLLMCSRGQAFYQVANWAFYRQQH